MPKPNTPTGPPPVGQTAITTPSALPVDNDHTVEATYFLGGLFGEFRKQVDRYKALTCQLMDLEARIEITEKTLCVIRDHLAVTIETTETAMPHDWEPILRSVRFVGLRLVDACVILLQERKRLTQKEIINELNAGTFRFRTNSPIREIHAALMRHPMVRREEDCWVWIGDENPADEPTTDPARNGTAHNKRAVPQT